MKYHTLFVIFEKAERFEIVVCCKLKVALYGLIINPYHAEPGFENSVDPGQLANERSQLIRIHCFNSARISLGRGSYRLAETPNCAIKQTNLQQFSI